jgi:hypothetical protein
MEVKGNFINYGSYVDVHDNERVYLSVEKGKVKIDEAQGDGGRGRKDGS